MSARVAVALVVMAAVGSAAALTLEPTSAAAQSVQDCGDLDQGVGVKNVTARRVGCPTARRLARRHDRTGRMTGYSFRFRRTGRPHETDIRGTRSGGRVVRYQYVSD